MRRGCQIRDQDTWRGGSTFSLGLMSGLSADDQASAVDGGRWKAWEEVTVQESSSGPRKPSRGGVEADRPLSGKRAAQPRQPTAASGRGWPGTQPPWPPQVGRVRQGARDPRERGCRVWGAEVGCRSDSLVSYPWDRKPLGRFSACQRKVGGKNPPGLVPDPRPAQVKSWSRL